MMNEQIGPAIHWPYSPPQPDIMSAINSAPHHFLAIRATGSTPADAGVSWPIGSRTPGAFEFAAGCARGYWLGLTDFEVIGADVRLSQDHTTKAGLPPGSTQLRMPVTISRFQVLPPAD